MTGYCKALAVAPSQPDRIYAGGCINSAGAVVTSTDRGASWVQTATAPADTVTGILVHPSDPARVLVATSGGVWGTTDAGGTWARLWTGRGLRSLAGCPLGPETLVVAGSDGVWKSTNGGANWAEMNDGLGVRSVNCLAFGGPGRAALFAGTAGGAVYAWQFATAVVEPTAPAPVAAQFATLARSRVLLCPALQGREVRLLDVAGRCVLATRVGSELDLGRFAPGVYTLESGAARQRLVKIE